MRASLSFRTALKAAPAILALSGAVLAAVSARASTVTARYFTITPANPDFPGAFIGGAVNPGLVGPTLGPDGLPVATPKSGFNDVNADGELLWWTPNSIGGTTVVKAGTSFAYPSVVSLPFNIQNVFFPNGPSGSDGSPQGYVSAELQDTFVTPTGGAVTLSLGSDDDAWVFVNGKLVDDNGGVHPPTVAQTQVVGILPGTNTIDLFYDDRRAPGASLSFDASVTLNPLGPSVPEPSTWAMMLLGFAGLGFAGGALRAKLDLLRRASPNVQEAVMEFYTTTLRISTRQIVLAVSAIMSATIVSTSSDASGLFLGSVDAPLTFTEGQGTTGDSFNEQCVSCVQGPLNDLPKPFGLNLFVFDAGPASPFTQVPTPTGPYDSEVLGGNINFSLINPDGTTQFSTAGARLSEEGPLTIGIEGTPGTPEVLIQITIPGPVTVNDDSGEEGPGPTNFIVNGDLYVGIFGYSNTELSIADVGPPFVDCSQPGSSEFCSETFLSFTLDATLEVSTSPISFTSVFPPSATSIPEPSTWALMLLGFAGLGFAGWRSSRRTAAFAE